MAPASSQRRAKRRVRVLIDTDVFVIDLRYPRDARYATNQAFLRSILTGKVLGRTTLYNVLEVCGILSFNLSAKRLDELFAGFAERFNVQVLFPPGQDAVVCFDLARLLQTMKHKLAFGDALIADLVHTHRRRIDVFVTWNARHFSGKLPVPALTPQEALAQLGGEG